MKLLTVLAVAVALVGCDLDDEPVDTLPPLETGLADEATFGFDWCDAVRQHYGDVEGLLEYMNADNPTPVPSTLEELVRDEYEKCSEQP